MSSDIRIDLEKVISEAKDGRIKYLEDQILAYKEQQKINLAVKKDLDEKLDKASADFRVLWVEKDRLKGQLAHEKAERDNLADTVTKMDKTIRDLNERNSNLRARLADKNSDLDELYQTINELTEQNKTLKDALDQTAKDAEDSFKHGKIKGAEEIWAALREACEGRPTGDNQKIFGYYTVGEILQNLSPTWFMTKHDEYKEKEARDIKIGDEIVVIGLFGSDDSDCGIVHDINEEPDGSKCYHVIGPCNCVAFGDNAIAEGSIRKTGKHYDNIPFDYIA